MMRFWTGIPLWQRVFVALILGMLLGVFWPTAGLAIDWVGELFVRLIRMLIIPLVFTTLIAGIVSLDNIRKLGRIKTGRLLGIRRPVFESTAYRLIHCRRSHSTGPSVT